MLGGGKYFGPATGSGAGDGVAGADADGLGAAGRGASRVTGALVVVGSIDAGLAGVAGEHAPSAAPRQVANEEMAIADIG
jgi:hypothetical protein